MSGPSPDPEVCEALIVALGAQAKAVGDAIMAYRPDLGESLLELAHVLRPVPLPWQLGKTRLTLVASGPFAG